LSLLKEATKKKIKDETLDWIYAIIYALIFGTIIRLYVFETMMVPTPSMVPTIQVYDRLFVEKVTYEFAEPNRSSIVVFWTPFVDIRAQQQLRAFDKFMDFFAPAQFEGHVKYVKRLVGKPGDTLRLVPLGETFWEDIKNGEIQNIPDWLNFIIDYYESVDYIPTQIKNKVSILEINGEILPEFENIYYLRDAIFEDPNFFDYIAYPDEYSYEIATSDLFFMYKDNFTGRLIPAKPTIEWYKEMRDTLLFTDFYESELSKLDLPSLIFKDEEGLVNVKIPEGYYFFMGDNTLESQDSRFFGFVPVENAIGTTFLRIYPFDRFGKI